MLVQLQQEHPDGTRDGFVAQAEFEEYSPDTQDKFRAWLADVRSRHPLPDGARWLVVNERSKYFFWAAPQSEAKAEKAIP